MVPNAKKKPRKIAQTCDARVDSIRTDIIRRTIECRGKAKEGRGKGKG